MKRIMIAIAAVVSLTLSGCASQRVITPLVPPVADFKSSYRKTQEVILVSCTFSDTKSGWGKRPRHIETTSVVETTDSGIRFTVVGCMGSIGDRFRLTY